MSSVVMSPPSCICSNKDKNFKANHNYVIRGDVATELYL